MDQDLQQYLHATPIVDSDNPVVRNYTTEIIRGIEDPVGRAAALYLAVRDGIRYDPYAPFFLPEHYRASYVIQRGRSFCVPKASLLCALARSCGIPGRLGFATVRNHLATKQLLDFLGTDLFVFHGFVELYLEGKWVKATPAFNRELCARHKVPPLEFDGRQDSIFHPFNSKSQKYMEYVEYLGVFSDVPVADILSAWERTYGIERVQSWKEMHAPTGESSLSDFSKEEVWKG